MMNTKNYCIVALLALVFSCSEATYRNQLHSVATLTMPFYPKLCKIIKNDSLMYSSLTNPLESSLKN
jgi:hypothetical protein